MKMDNTTRLYKKIGINENHKNVNKTIKAVIINFGDDRGDIVVKNDNFGTRRKYADFTNGKKLAGLNPMQIVFCGWEGEACFSDSRYIGAGDQIHYFQER